MKAYSIDLRERVVAACALPGVRIYQVAAQFRVSISFVDKLLALVKSLVQKLNG